jgi:hypothetical protein
MSSLVATQDDGYYLPVAPLRVGDYHNHPRTSGTSRVNKAMIMPTITQGRNPTDQNKSSSSSSSYDDPIETGVERDWRKEGITQEQVVQALLKANEVTHQNDADGNAAIRFHVSKDIALPQSGVSKMEPWLVHPGMALGSGTIQDQVQAKSATYGNSKRREQERSRPSCDSRESYPVDDKASKTTR